jgi:predicted amidophosphoribosyltransferase
LPSVSSSCFLVPLWIPTFIFTICSIPAFVALRRRRRARHGYCSNCGYDLRGSMDACPECGSEMGA